jgi:hypothetical protein
MVKVIQKFGFLPYLPDLGKNAIMKVEERKAMLLAGTISIYLTMPSKENSVQVRYE